MTNSSPPFDFSKMPTIERVVLAQQLWDSVVTESDALPVTEEQKAEVRNIVAEIDAGKSNWLSWDQVITQFRNLR